MNLTLSIDERLVKEARRAARALGKSLNQLIREYLEQLTSRDNPERDVEELRRVSSEARGRSRGWRFNRDEIHERP
jgi:mRNA-degrading endonuclease RelE of RelBE toxin-antitoxin system